MTRTRLILVAAVCALGIAGCGGVDEQASAPGPAVTASVPVGRAPLDVAVTPDGRSAWVVSEAEITIVDLERNAVTRTIPFSAGPKDVAFSPDGSRAVVASGTLAGGVTVLDTAAATVVAVIPVDGGPLYDLALSPDGDVAYAANQGGGLAAVDLATQAVTTVELPPGGRSEVDVTPDGRYAVVGNSAERSAPSSTDGVSIVDTASMAVTATVALPDRPGSVAVSADGRLAFVGLFSMQQVVRSELQVIDIGRAEVVSTLPVGGRTSGVAVGPGTARVYVTTGVEDGILQVGDVAAATGIVDVPVGTCPTGVTISADGRTAYVANNCENTLSVVDLGEPPPA